MYLCFKINIGTWITGNFKLEKNRGYSTYCFYQVELDARVEPVPLALEYSRSHCCPRAHLPSLNILCGSVHPTR